MLADFLTKPLQGTAFNEIRTMLMNLLVEYLYLFTKDVYNNTVVSKPDYFPIPSRLMNPLEKKVRFVASPQECVGGVTKQ